MGKVAHWRLSRSDYPWKIASYEVRGKRWTNSPQIPQAIKARWTRNWPGALPLAIT